MIDCCFGRPIKVGKIEQGLSSPAKPALMLLEPLSIITEVKSVSVSSSTISGSHLGFHILEMRSRRVKKENAIRIVRLTFSPYIMCVYLYLISSKKSEYVSYIRHILHCFVFNKIWIFLFFRFLKFFLYLDILDGRNLEICVCVFSNNASKAGISFWGNLIKKFVFWLFYAAIPLIFLMNRFEAFICCIVFLKKFRSPKIYLIITITRITQLPNLSTIQITPTTLQSVHIPHMIRRASKIITRA